MDWASSEWKQGLSSVAIQKVSALEEKVENLQKERQKLNLQNESLKIALDKEKRRVDKEKQNVAEIQRELQTLSETCKDIEDRHQKLQNEIKKRDSRISCLEVLLAQHKSENCKLQQLVNDVKDLRPLREAALAKREQKVLNSKESNDENVSPDEVNASQKEKIAEQETLIEELKKQISVSSSKDNTYQGATPFKTPVRKVSISVTDSPSVNNKNSENVWSAFGSTPARGNKDTALRQNADSMGLDTRDEKNQIKILNDKFLELQNEFSSLCTQLEETSSNESSLKKQVQQMTKEKNDLSNEVLSKAYAFQDLQIQVDELTRKRSSSLEQNLENKSLECIELNKKLETSESAFKDQLKILNAKLLGAEKEYSSLDTKHKESLSNEDSLKEQLENLVTEKADLARQMDALSNSNGGLQCSLDKLNERNMSLEEDLKAKISECVELNKRLAESDSTFKGQLEDLEEKLLLAQKEYTSLQTQLQSSISTESNLKERAELLEKEKSDFLAQITNLTSVTQNLKSALDELSLHTLSIQNDLDSNTKECVDLKKKLEESEIASKNVENAWEEKFLDEQNKYSCLDTQYKESLSRNSTLQEKVELLVREKSDLNTQVETLTKAAHGLKSHMDRLHEKVVSSEEEVDHKTKENQELSVKLADLEKYQIQLKILNEEALAARNECTLLQTKIQNSASAEASLTEKIGLLENENNVLVDQVLNLNDSVQKLQSQIDELNETNHSLKMNIESRVKECSELAEKLVVAENAFKLECEESSCKINDILKEKDLVETSLKEKVELLLKEENELIENVKEKMSEIDQKNVLMQELEEKLTGAESKYSDLVKDIKNMADQKEILESKLELMEKKKTELNDNLVAEINKTRVLNGSIQELKNTVASLKEELTNKSLLVDKFSVEVQNSKKEYEDKIEELNATLSKNQAEMNSLQAGVMEGASIEASFQEKVDVLEKEKVCLLDQLALLEKKADSQESCNEELKNKIHILDKELLVKSSEIEEISQHAKEEFEVKIHELEGKLSSVNDECVELKNQLNLLETRESSLQEKLFDVEKEKSELTIELQAEKDQSSNLVAFNEELMKNNSALKEDLAQEISRKLEIEALLTTSRDEHQIKVQDIEVLLLNSRKDNKALGDKCLKYMYNEEQWSGKISALEKVELQLKESLKSAEEEIRQFEIKSAELTKMITSLQEESLSKSSQMNELISFLESSKEEFEFKVQQLEEKLSAQQSDYSVLQKEHKECTSCALTLKEKLQSKEEEISKAKERLEEECSKSNSLNENVEKLAQVISELENKVLMKCNELNEANNQLDLVKSDFETYVQEKDNEALKDRSLEYSLNEKQYGEKISSLEKEEHKLKEALKEAYNEISKLNEKSEEFTKTTASLKEELSSKSSQINELVSMLKSSKEEFEALIEDLGTALSASEADVLNKVQQHDFLQEKFIQLERNNIDLLEENVSANEKIHSLRITCEDLNKEILALKDEVSNKESEIVELNQHIASLKASSETHIADLNNMLSASEEEVTSMQSQMQQNDSSETSLYVKLELLEEEKGHLVECLENETKKSLSLENCVEELKEQVSILEGEVSRKSSEMVDLNQLLESAMNEIEKLTATEAKLNNLQNQLQESISETALKKSLEVFESEKTSILDSLAFSSEKTEMLKSENKELQSKISDLEVELMNKSSEYIDLYQRMISLEEDLKAKIEGFNPIVAADVVEVNSLEEKLEMQAVKVQPILEHKDKHYSTPVKQNESLKLELSGIGEEFEKENSSLKTHCASLELQLKDLSQSKILLTRTLNLLEGKRKQLASSLESKSTEILSLERSINLLNEEIKLLKDEMVLERKKSIDSDNMNQKLRDKVASLETEVVVLNLSLNVCSENEVLLVEKRNELENNREHFVDLDHCLKENKGNWQLFESQLTSFQELYALLLEKTKNVNVEEGVMEITCITEELKPLLEEVGSKLKQLADTLNLLKEVDVKKDTSSELEELKELKNNLENQVRSLEDKLIAAQTKCADLEDELLQRMDVETDAEEKLLRIDEKLKYDESLKEQVHVLKSDLEDLNSSFGCLDDEVKQKLLEADVTEQSGILKEYQRNTWKLQGWTSKARSKIQLLETKLRASLLREELLGIELSSLKALLNEETCKVNLCELGFGELKVILWHLQDIIAIEDSFCSKCTSTTPEMNCVMNSKYPDTDLRVVTLEDYSSLLMLSMNLTSNVLDLEKDLVIALEGCQFLCGKGLVKENMFSATLKKFLFLRRKIKQCHIMKRFMLSISQLLKSNAMLFKDLYQHLSNSAFSECSNYSLHKFLNQSFYASDDIMLTISKKLQSYSLSPNFISMKDQLTIQSSSLHLPIVYSSKYLIFIHQITETAVKRNSKVLMPFSLDLLFSRHNYQTWLKLKQGLMNVDAQYIPHLLNFIMSVCENISFIFNQELNCDAKNHSASLVWGLNKCHLSKLIEYLLSQITSFHDQSELQQSNLALEEALAVEKAKHQLLNSTIEGIESDLSETFQEKESLKKLAVSAGLLLSYLQNQFANWSSFPTASFNDENDESCFCEDCVESSVGVPECPNSERLSPSNCLLWLTGCLDSANLLHAEVITLREYRDIKEESMEHLVPPEKLFQLESKNSALLEEVEKYRTMCSQLQDKNVSLRERFEEAGHEIQNLRLEVEKKSGEVEEHCKSNQDKLDLISELQLKNSELSLKINDFENICGTCDEQIKKLSADVEHYVSELSSKEKEVLSWRKVIDELKNDTKNYHLKCDDYENKIKLLNSTISKLEEEKGIIEELQSKVVALKQSNESLNLTIENIEEELQNVYTGKNQLTEKIDNLLKERICLKETAEKYEKEKEHSCELLFKLKELEKEKKESDSIVNELKIKTEILEKDVTVLKGIQREQEYAIFDKNKTLKEGDKTVKKLRQAITELEEKLCLVLEKHGENESEPDLKVTLEEANKQIMELKQSEQKYLDKLSEFGSERDSLVSKINESSKDIEKISCKVTVLEKSENSLKMENFELQKKIKIDDEVKTSLREELLEKEKSCAMLSAEYDNLMTELGALKSHNAKLIAEKDEAAQKEKQLETEMIIANKNVLKIQSLLKKIQEECNTLSTENGRLKMKLYSLDSTSHLEKDWKSKTNLLKSTKWNADLLQMILGEVKNNSWYPHSNNLESNIVNAIEYWNQSDEKFCNLEKEMSMNFLHDLQTFFIALSTKRKEESELITKAKLIKDVAQRVSQFCSSWGTKCQAETSFFENAYNEVCSRPIEEMQNALDSLTDSFNALKNIIWEKEELVKALEGKLKNVSTREGASTEVKDHKTEKSKYEWKFNILKYNLKKLEEKYNEVSAQKRDLETLVKKLQEEKEEWMKTTNDPNGRSSKEIDELRTQNAEFESRIKHLEEEKKKMESEIQTLRDENKSLDDECEFVIKQLKGVKKNYYDLYPKFVETEEKLKESEKLVESLQETITELQQKKSNRSDVSPCKGKENFFRRPL